MAEQVERAQAAVALLSDPAAIDERLELSRADDGPGSWGPCPGGAPILGEAGRPWGERRRP